jgi:hypothetical protein
LSLTTCEGRTGNTDTVLQVNRGSLRLANGRCAIVPSPNRPRRRLQRRPDRRVRRQSEQHPHLRDHERRRGDRGISPSRSTPARSSAGRTAAASASLAAAVASRPSGAPGAPGRRDRQKLARRMGD